MFEWVYVLNGDLFICRTRVDAQLTYMRSTAESEHLARQVAEQTLNDIEKEKEYLKLELKEQVGSFCSC